MHTRNVPAITKPLVLDGQVGYVRVATQSGLWPNSEATLVAGALIAPGLKIREIKGQVGGGCVDVYLIDLVTGLPFDASAFTVALGAALTIPVQRLWYGLDIDQTAVLTDLEVATLLNTVLPGGSTSAENVNVLNFPALQAVSVAALPLPTGAATETTCASILSKLNASVAVTGTFWPTTQPVSVAVLPLPSGAATSSNQTSGSQKARVLDQSGTGIDSVSQGPGANGLLSALGPTSFVFSDSNSTNVQLGIAGLFTGGIELIIAAQTLSLMLTCDQPGTLTLYQYIEDTGAPVTAWTFTLLANEQFSRSFTLNGNYFNLKFQNSGPAPTTTLNINAYYGILPPSTSLGNLPCALSEINGQQLTTAATGVLKVGVVGNTGAAFDAATGGVAPPNLLLAGGAYHATPPTFIDGRVGELQLDSAGNLKTTVTNSIGPATHAATTAVALSLTSVLLLAANLLRRGGSIYNNSTGKLYIRQDGAASLALFKAIILPGDYFELQAGVATSVYGIWDSGTGNAMVEELA